MNITLNDEQLSCSQPSLAAALDVVSIWGINPSRAHVGRLCAAAIGLCCQEARLPRYSMIDAAPIPYGGRVLEKLLDRGIHAEEIYTQGLELIKSFFARKGGGHLQRLMFSVARFWGRDPDWLDQLAPDLRHLVIADYYLSHQKPSSPAPATRHELERRVRKFQNRGVSDG